MFVMHTAERVIATLRAHVAKLRQAGLRSLSLFGSVARSETETDSDIDLAAEFDPDARLDLHQLTALERRIAELYLAVRWTFCPNRWRNACRKRSTGTGGVPSRNDPAASLADILENLERIEGYVAGLDREAGYVYLFWLWQHPGILIQSGSLDLVVTFRLVQVVFRNQNWVKFVPLDLFLITQVRDHRRHRVSDLFSRQLLDRGVHLTVTHLYQRVGKSVKSKYHYFTLRYADLTKSLQGA
jgi:predicted nucleotidyltransferase